MKDLFELVDNWRSPMNLLWNYKYLRRVAVIFSLSMIPIWIVLGFDSGIGQIEEALKALLIGEDVATAFHSIYGMSFHFSSFVIYGLTFCAMSMHLESVGLKHSKNIICSGAFTLFNIGVFELGYMALFAHFQMNRNILEWFITDFWKTPVIANFSFVLIGLMVFLLFIGESFNVDGSRSFRFRFKKELFVVFGLAFASLLLWIYFPLPVETLTIGEWTSSNLFPQTHYAYMLSSIHLRNDALHFVNVMVKAFFAITQLHFFAGFEELVVV